MRWLGLIMAALGGVAAIANLLLSVDQIAVLAFFAWTVMCIMGIIIVVKHPKEKKRGKSYEN